MAQLLIHGVYDLSTLEALLNLGVHSFSFDLRGKSLNLVKLSDLLEMTKSLIGKTTFLMFESETKETIHSFLDLLKKTPVSWEIIHSGNEDQIHQLDIPFYWHFHDQVDWQKVLSHSLIKGLWLPFRYQSLYEKMPEFWEKIDEKKLEIYLFAENFAEAENVDLNEEIHLGVGLSAEVESSYRKIDFIKLERLTFWKNFHETLTIE